MGIWLIFSPFILSYGGNSSWNQVMLGVIVAVLAAIRYLFPKNLTSNGLLLSAGLWLILSPFLLRYAKTVAYLNEITCGIAIVIMAAIHSSVSLKEET